MSYTLHVSIYLNQIDTWDTLEWNIFQDTLSWEMSIMATNVRTYAWVWWIQESFGVWEGAHLPCCLGFLPFPLHVKHGKMCPLCTNKHVSQFWEYLSLVDRWIDHYVGFLQKQILGRCAKGPLYTQTKSHDHENLRALEHHAKVVLWEIEIQFLKWKVNHVHGLKIFLWIV
jgi:hypothetical protein